MQNLVIMESPTKAKTIKNYLGSSYKVVASNGHIRDLPKSKMGIDIEDGFRAHYINIHGKGELISELRKEVQKSDRVYLATDPDREGEAIAWHLVNALSIPAEKVRRVTFNAITKSVVKSSIKAPRDIDMNIVNAQQTRRILDRIVGYKISPFLWKTVKGGLSAGRVQSVATRIIVDRENEIKAFVPKEYWTIDVDLDAGDGRHLVCRYFGPESANSKVELKNGDEADAICRDVSGKPFTVYDIRTGRKTKNPAPPFTTSTLQQEASRKLNFQSQRTMKVAQELYEGINLGSENGGAHGLITYMRTDSLRIAPEAQEAAKRYITERLGPQYYPQTTRQYKSRANAQDAHEAIRPATEMFEPDAIKNHLTNDQYRLYKLIWDRFIASQMESALLDTKQIDVVSAGHKFRTNGYTVQFQGFMSVYEESNDEREDPDGESAKLPDISKGAVLEQNSLTPAQHFTQPPMRYTEASLVKFLEEKGIGRPSTYATIISIITSREYVRRDGKSLCPTPLGNTINDIMSENFPDIVDYKFTAQMEDKLDAIEEGKADMVNVLEDFYEDFSRELETADVKLGEKKYEVEPEYADMVCDKCGSRMIIKSGRYGKFACCPNFPACRNTKPLNQRPKPQTPSHTRAEAPEATGLKCEKCGADLVLRHGKYGSFYACSRYPACKYTKQISRSLGVPCPKCGADIVVKNGKNRSVFYGCTRYPECDFSSWDMPTNEKCPKCGNILYRKKGKDAVLQCLEKDCGYQRKE